MAKVKARSKAKSKGKSRAKLVRRFADKRTAEVVKNATGQFCVTLQGPDVKVPFEGGKQMRGCFSGANAQARATDRAKELASAGRL